MELGISADQYCRLYYLVHGLDPVDLWHDFSITPQNLEWLLDALDKARRWDPRKFEDNPEFVAYAREIVVDAYVNMEFPPAFHREMIVTLGYLRAKLLPVAMQSRYYWSRHFGGSSGVLGKPEAFTGQRGFSHIERGPPAGMTRADEIALATTLLGQDFDRYRNGDLAVQEFQRRVHEYLTTYLNRLPAVADIDRFLNGSAGLPLAEALGRDGNLVRNVVIRARSEGAFSAKGSEAAKPEARGREERARLEARKPMGR